MLENLSLTGQPLPPPEKLVVSIHKDKEYHRVEDLVVMVEAAFPLWTSDWNMLSIQSMRNVPSPAEDRLDQQPVLWECGAPHHLILIGHDSITDLRHKLVDGRTGHPGGILPDVGG